MSWAGDGAVAPAQARIAAALARIGPVLGVDAGGTGTRAALVIDGAPQRSLTAGPFNFLLHDDGVAQMAALIRAAGPAAAGLGIPGIARQRGAAGAFAAAVSAACGGLPVRVASDSVTAWLGAFLGEPGIVVIAGTGSGAVGGSAGALVRIGGHGFLIGDEGGGYWIGRRAVRAALAAAEGAGPPTVLGDALAEATGAALDELVVRVHRAPADRTILAGLAPLVGRCAEGPDPDPVAGAIVSDAAQALAGHALALQRRLGDLPVAGVGGVFGLASLRAEFGRATGAVPPAASPQVGAALLAASPDDP
ncbi:MAG TPA: BadF/BadG/BcrA/BcrD ATPase family protein [Streptosporangiaceae bacterium]|jgi:N-acetylglucosamine kinase-like BadF-type ATPase